MFQLTEAHPELVGILKNLGFAGVSNPIARNTIGRATTLRQGCERQGKELPEVVRALEQHGFTVKM